MNFGDYRQLDVFRVQQVKDHPTAPVEFTCIRLPRGRWVMYDREWVPDPTLKEELEALYQEYVRRQEVDDLVAQHWNLKAGLVAEGILFALVGLVLFGYWGWLWWHGISSPAYLGLLGVFVSIAVWAIWDQTRRFRQVKAKLQTRIAQRDPRF
jgi:hypothetical protein